MSQIFLRQHQYGKCCTILVRYRFESSFVYASLFVTDMLSLRDKEKFSNHLQTCCPMGQKNLPSFSYRHVAPNGAKKNSPIICRHVAPMGQKNLPSFSYRHVAPNGAKKILQSLQKC